MIKHIICSTYTIQLKYFSNLIIISNQVNNTKNNFGSITSIIKDCIKKMDVGNSLMYLRTKFRGSPKALVTKLFKETFKVA